MSKSTQLPLALRLDDSSTFENYFVAEANRLPVDALQRQAEEQGERFIYLFGQPGSGCSHLLQACCHLMEQRKAYSLYLPVRELLEFEPEALLEGIEDLDLLCLDDVDTAMGHEPWERALFNCYNRALASGTALLFGAHAAVSQGGWQLPDLTSRLNGFTVFALHGLSDEDYLQALRFRARCLGMELPIEVAEYIYLRCQRDLHHLFAVIDQLDRASLAAQRKLTIPFVKAVMAW